MSKVLGIPDLKDFLEQEDESFLKKIKFYMGYRNYIFDNPMDTSVFANKNEWYEYFHNTIITKSLYRNLGEGYVVIEPRDYISIQQDKNAGNGYNETEKRLLKMRKNYIKELIDLGFNQESAESIADYEPELDERMYYDDNTD